MHVVAKPLKSIHSIQLSPDEEKILNWLKNASWQAQVSAREPIPYKTKVPEFFGGVRLYHVKASGASGSQGPLELFIKKLEYQGTITKQELYPVTVENGARFLSLKKSDLDNLGIGEKEEEED